MFNFNNIMFAYTFDALINLRVQKTPIHAEMHVTILAFDQ